MGVVDNTNINGQRAEVSARAQTLFFHLFASGAEKKKDSGHSSIN